MRRVLVGFFLFLHELLRSPAKVIWVCLFLVVLNLIVDGSLFRLWKLHQDNTDIRSKIETLNQQNEALEIRIREAKNPAFLERVARERFDLVGERDLVFVFSDSNGEEP